MAPSTERSDTPIGAKRSAKKGENRRKRRRKNARQNPKTPLQTQQQEKRKRPETPKVPILVPRVQEPVPTCAICGKPIEAISQAICGPQPEVFNHFDCVLRQIEEDEKVLSHQKVSYIGKGVFAIIETDATGKFSIVKRIPFETPETFAFMKRYVEEQKR